MIREIKGREEEERAPDLEGISSDGCFRDGEEGAAAAAAREWDGGGGQRKGHAAAIGGEERCHVRRRRDAM